ncbi:MULTISPECIES: peptidoglycan D,D-transpeptidase FtsI family protein [Corynebacterium]|uniref:Penicillin-binding protein 2 n=1 Tax=Corynebacterium kefirresidentii TaxID=1979527 RepID=A0ABT8Q0Z6_9CORY|nr:MULTISPECIES: penicillin-binding protein 2 [Corynebacterium]MCG7239794.1 penicillin-binding protein 2 [Corynebacterium kefirresidentii]MCG7282062.1 penicillin-binding protein 2 [Corynebacterium kefirresidentii]MCG7449220.1 penicillin-binding protein 2 [Corynebacterium kefirresidentii]MCG7451256.1 penicillin-binding protein 2 [Corynebacterium kefirresidentii]MCK6083550.1 penicillin-binding protein 2 [Corynebacterium kefirresidentii]
MRKRLRIIVSVVLVAMVVLVGRLAWVQLVWGPDLSAKAVTQRERVYIEPARRGEILDRDGQRLAYTMKSRSLTVSPTRLRDELKDKAEIEAQNDGSTEGMDDKKLDSFLNQKMEETLKDMAEGIPKMIEDSGASTSKVEKEDILNKLKADTQYEVLVRNVDPDVAVEISNKYHGVAADRQDIRQYPNGAIGENVVGKVSMDGHGQFGFEAARDTELTGIDGQSTEDVSADGQVIPGTLRDVVDTVDGRDVTLTLDLDLQTYVQQKLEKAKANSKASGAEAVVLDAATGQVLAMANTDTVDPNKNIEDQLDEGKDFENHSVSHPYEPGSVAKVVTAAAALQEGVTTPDEVHQVPGSIDMAGVTVNDAWQHGTEPYTTTGIFGKSSNVGTLMLADKLGQEKYAKYLEKFGLGNTTGVELPNESAGSVPDLEQWSGGTFANLPIGQGQSWTTLQMASVYQTLANGGERIEPRIIDSVKGPDGKEEKLEEPKKTQVISPETAKTTVDMFRAVFQDDDAGLQNGTAGNAQLKGYQLSGKTGTAQKVDPNTGAYSNSAYWITFAGIAPADDPRFVVAVMLDEPKSGVEDNGGGGQSAAPIFRDIASWLLNRDNIPTSKPAPRLTLRAQ